MRGLDDWIEGVHDTSLDDPEEDTGDPEYVLGAVLAQLEDLTTDEQVEVLQAALREVRPIS